MPKIVEITQVSDAKFPPSINLCLNYLFKDPPHILEDVKEETQHTQTSTVTQKWVGA
jgi:hypothetical protein